MATSLFETSVPDALIEELAARRCVLFLGSGVSATSVDDDGKSPMTWEKFITGIKGTIKNPKGDDIKYIDEKIEHGDYLLALQAIYDLASKPDYIRYLEKEYKQNYVPSTAHKCIQRIDSKVVVTTNFDKIYETLCSGSTYTVMNYDDMNSIVHAIKSPRNVILKAHGTIDKPDKIIFTARQYYESQEKYREFYEMLAALFMTNTVVFLGYSLNDPDINLILQYLHKTATESSPHYLITKTGTPRQVKEHWKRVYNVEVIEYGEEYKDFIPALEYLADNVEIYRSRALTMM